MEAKKNGMRLRLLLVKQQQPFPSTRIWEMFGCFRGLEVVLVFPCAHTWLLSGLVFVLIRHGHTVVLSRVVCVPQNAGASVCIPGLFLAIQICFALSHTDKMCKCSRRTSGNTQCSRVGWLLNKNIS